MNDQSIDRVPPLESTSSLAPVSDETGESPATSLDPAKMFLLYNAAKALASTTDLDQLLNVVVGEVQTVLNCEGAGVLLHDTEKDDFYWRIVQDKGSFLSSAREEIRIPKDKGVCGWVFSTGKPALVHDAANDPRLHRPVETKSGFTTRNMVCVPLQTREKRLGALYALNKAGSFNGEDVEIMVALSGNVALALENASYFERLVSSHKELERLIRVKNKVLNHLSHELKTPLAIIEASLRILERRLESDGLALEKFPFERILRNVERLKTVEKQVADIIENKQYSEHEIIFRFLDYLEDLIEIKEEEEPRIREAMEALQQKIVELFPAEIEETAKTVIEYVFNEIESQVNAMKEDRILNIEFVPPEPAIIKIQPQIVLSVIGGLVRNAVENTPDHGKIVITGENSQTGYSIVVKDFGVGIPESEQANVFEGFCPVQETDLYSSGRRYEFNAGGTGTDLLRIKVFSKRFGFKVSFMSARCSCIPSTRDLCPGDITKCACCDEIEDCYDNGGTQFVVEFPQDLIEQSDEHGDKQEEASRNSIHQTLSYTLPVS
jgi:K+-sensing histidine kinase KdpD